MIDNQLVYIQTSSILVNVVATNATLDFLCLHCFSTPPEIDRAEDHARANTVPDIWAWRVHSRLHPLLPGEQLALWAKLNSAKFLCQYRALALSEIFIQQKFCAIRYTMFGKESSTYPVSP